MTIPKKCPHCGAPWASAISTWSNRGYYVDHGASYACGAVVTVKCQKRQKRKAKK